MRTRRAEATGDRRGVVPTCSAIAHAARLCVFAGGLASAVGSAWSQDAATKARYRVEPYVSLEETLTDNARSAGAGSGVELVTRATAGLRASSNSERLKGVLDYALSGIHYSRGSGQSTHQHTLNASGDLEWYERQGFLRGQASITRVARSPFGRQVFSGALPDSASNEQRSLSLMPSWSGQIAQAVRLDASAAMRATKTDGVSAADSHGSTVSLRVVPFEVHRLSWAIGGQLERSSYSQTRSIRSDWLYAEGAYQWLDADLQLSARAGQERSNVVSAAVESKATVGGGMVWQPSPRTQVRFQVDRRNQGTTHDFSAQYRTPRTTWRLLDSRTTNLQTNAQAADGRGSLFDRYYDLFAVIEPDPVLRLAAVMAYLQSLGVSLGEAMGSSGLLRSAATRDDRTEFSVGWRAPRLNTSLLLARTASERLDKSLVGFDELDLVGNVSGTSFAWLVDYKLQPDLLVGFNLNALRNKSRLTGLRTDQQGLNILLTGQLNQKETWSLAYRYLHSVTTAQSGSSENAIIATYRVRF